MISWQQLTDEVGPAENVDASAAENFDNHAAIVNEWLNDVNDANINATAVETLLNQAIDNEWQNHEIINATVGNVNGELDDQQDSGDSRIGDLDWRTIQHLNNQLRIMDGWIHDLEQRVCICKLYCMQCVTEMSSQALIPRSGVHPQG